MKAVVVEIQNRIAAVLSDDGRITKIKNQNYTVGQVIEMKSIHTLRFIPAVAAAAAAIMLCTTSAYAYFTPYSYVSLDINPSIEYTLNRFNRILKVTGVNEDGEKIVEEFALSKSQNKKIEKVLNTTIQQIKKAGFLTDKNEDIVITTSGKDLNKAEKLADDLEQSTENDAENDTINVETFAVGLERVQNARQLGVTPGKLNLVEKLQASSENPDSIDIEKWLEKPVKEIMQEIKKNRKAIDKEDDSDIDEPGSNDSSSEASESSQEDWKQDKEEKNESKAVSKAEKSEEKLAEKQVKQEDKQHQTQVKSQEKQEKQEKQENKIKESQQEPNKKQEQEKEEEKTQEKADREQAKQEQKEQKDTAKENSKQKSNGKAK